MNVKVKLGFVLIPCAVLVGGAAAQTHFSDSHDPDKIARIAIRELRKAKTLVLVQAYGFTDTNISHVLDSLHEHGVPVGVVLDKSSVKAKRSVLPELMKHKIDVWIDDLHKIAHNKIIIIDTSTVLSGSYNWTVAAKRNAENMGVIKDRKEVLRYIRNWYRHQWHSKRKFNHPPSVPGVRRKVPPYRVD